MSPSTEHRLGGRVRMPVVMVALLIGAVCAGVLAMHHLAGGGHAASHSSAAALAHGAPSGEGMPPMTDAAGVDQSDWTDSGAQLASSDGLKVAAGACALALLSGLIVLVANGAGSWLARRGNTGTVLHIRTGGPRPGRGPPRDLLAQLCVLRT